MSAQATPGPTFEAWSRVTTYRLAIEEATSALRMGRPDVALAALERVGAPGIPTPRAAT